MVVEWRLDCSRFSRSTLMPLALLSHCMFLLLCWRRPWGWRRSSVCLAPMFPRVEPPSEIEAKVEGTPLGVVGRLTARSVLQVMEAGQETKIRYETESTLAGKLGSIGQPVLRAKAKEMEREFAKRLQAHFAAG